MNVGVAYADKFKQIWLKLDVPEGSTVRDAIEKSGLLTQFPDTPKANVSQVVNSIKIDHPEIYRRCCDVNGNLRETLTLFVNGDHIRYRNGLETVVEEGDEIYIVPLITGG